jgi:hypothetical protein
VKVILGRFKNKLVNCGVTACAHANQRWFWIPGSSKVWFDTLDGIREKILGSIRHNRVVAYFFEVPLLSGARL